MDAAEHVLWVRPHLPKGVRFLNVPLFSPAGPSWVRLEVQSERPHAVEIHLSFQQPLLLHEIVTNPLHPSGQCEVRCLKDNQILETSLERDDSSGEPLLRVRLARPAVVQGTLMMTVIPGRK
jgi:hypothetical protein